jgi:hypothetical protein
MILKQNLKKKKKKKKPYTNVACHCTLANTNVPCHATLAIPNVQWHATLANLICFFIGFCYISLS